MDYPQRKRTRLQSFDYSTDGYYFVTICTKNKEKLFGYIPDVTENKVIYSDVGRLVERHIQQIGNHYQNVQIDKYVVMPNHIHMIVIIGCSLQGAESNPNLSDVIGLFKSGVSRELKRKVWQASFHDHIIRTQRSYERIWNYIDVNPLVWNKDIFFC